MALGAESDLASPVRPEVHHAATRYACSSFITFSSPYSYWAGAEQPACIDKSLATGLGCTFVWRKSPFPLDSLDLGAKPFGQRLFHFGLTAGAIQVFNRQPLFRQVDEPAGDAFLLLAFRNKLFEQATLAGMRARRIAEVRTNRRILEDSGGTP